MVISKRNDNFEFLNMVANNYLGMQARVIEFYCLYQFNLNLFLNTKDFTKQWENIKLSNVFCLFIYLFAKFSTYHAGTPNVFFFCVYQYASILTLHIDLEPSESLYHYTIHLKELVHVGVSLSYTGNQCR